MMKNDNLKIVKEKRNKNIKKQNTENYIPIIFINKGHKVFYHKAPSNKIIKTIKTIIIPEKNNILYKYY